jgi:hypothetical protein
MAAITTRAGKGSPLTNAEMDANLNNLNESQTVMGEPMGHADKTQSTISFDAGTRTFTIAPVSTSFVVWCKGEKYTYTTAQTVVIPDTAGLHFIYFSSAGVLSTKMSYFTWDEDAPTSYVYWNATNNEAIYFADERHGVTLDWQTHEYLHRTRGAAIANGFAASGYTLSGDGSADADAQITIEGGTFFDEDMQIDIVSSNTPTANTFEQDLNSPARIPILYLEGSEWRITSPTDYPVKQGTARPQYNLFTGGAWTLVDVTNTDFTCTWILATNNLNYPVVGVISQSNLSTLNNAEAAVFEDLDLPGFPSVEFRPLYKLIFQSNSSYSNTPHSRLRRITDIRSISSVGVAAALVTDHGNLSGLTDDDHPQYLSTSDVRSGIASAVKKSLIPSTPVAGGVAYGTADSLDFSVAGTAGQVLTSGGASVPTWTTASSANTASAIVQRDASGNFTAGTITADLSGNATTATTATHLAGGGANRLAYQTGSGASAFAVAPTVTDTFLKWDGSAFAWANAGGANITDDTSTNATYYPTFSTSNSGTFSSAKTSSTKLTYNPSTGTLAATTFSGALSGNASTATTATNAAQLTGVQQTNLLIGKYAATADINAANDTGSFSARGNASFPASMSFHREGVYAINMGLSTSNTFVIGGWSASANAFSMTGGGALTMLNNITAYSDERVKTNWRDLQPDFIEQLAKVKHGIYDRTDQESTQVGVSAQSLRPIMEHAIMEDEEGKLSVAYGNAALVACIKLAQRVLELEEKLKERI